MKLKRLESKSKVLCLHNTTEHTKQHLEAWVHLSARPMKYFIKLTHVKNSPIIKSNYSKNTPQPDS